MRKLRRTGLVFAALLIFSACGSEEPDTGSADSGNMEENGGDTIQVEAFDFGFEPDTISLDSGEEVSIEFNNTGGAPHTFTSEDLGVDITTEAGGNGAATVSAPEDGTYPFQCSIHPDRMSGEIIVGDGGAGAGSEDTKEGSAENDDGFDY